MSGDKTGLDLIAAAKDGNLLLIEKLVKRGAPLNERDTKGATALFWACCRGHSWTCLYLLNAGCDVNAQDNNGATALQAATDNGHVDCVRALLQRNVNLDVQNQRRDTALHVAAYRGHTDIVRLLAQAGADPFIKNALSLTPVQEAKAQHHHICSRVLSQYMETLGASEFISLPPTTDSSPWSIENGQEKCPSWPHNTNSGSAPPHLPKLSSREQPVVSSTSVGDHEEKIDIFGAKDIQPHTHHMVYKSDNGFENTSNIPSVQNVHEFPNLPDVSSLPPTSTDFSTTFNTFNTESSGYSSLFPELQSTTPETSYQSYSSDHFIPIHSRPGAPSRPINNTSDARDNVNNAKNIRSQSNSAISTCVTKIVDSGSKASPDPIIPRRVALLKQYESNGHTSNSSPEPIKEPQSDQNIISKDESKTTRRRKDTGKQLLPGVNNVSSFIEQLQIQVVELQEELVKNHSVIADLQNKISDLSRENVLLKANNSYLESLLQKITFRPGDSQTHDSTRVVVTSTANTNRQNITMSESNNVHNVPSSNTCKHSRRSHSREAVENSDNE